MTRKFAYVLEFKYPAIQAFRDGHDAHSDPGSAHYVDLGPHVTLAMGFLEPGIPDIPPGSSAGPSRKHLLLTLETSAVVEGDIAYLPVNADSQVCEEMRDLLRASDPPGKSGRFHCTLAWPASSKKCAGVDAVRELVRGLERRHGARFTVVATVRWLEKGENRWVLTDR